MGHHGENNKIKLRKDDADRGRGQLQRTNKFKSILVLLSETFRKGRFRLFHFSPSTTLDPSLQLVGYSLGYNTGADMVAYMVVKSPILVKVLKPI